MMTVRLAAILLLIYTAATGIAEPPVFAFKPNGVTVNGFAPGTRLVWLALTRERNGHHGKLSAGRGVAVVTGNGTVTIAGPGSDRSRSLWLMAEIGGDFVASKTPPGYRISKSPIVAEVTAGADRITVISPFIELVYVQRGGGAWSISASDGGLNDADATQNTQIVLPLSSMERFHGGGEPLRQIGAGDVILMIDRFTNRMTSLEVAR